MFYKDFTDANLIKLIEDANKKQTVHVERDSKLLTEMNNALNWIITLLTVMLGASINIIKANNTWSQDREQLNVTAIVFCIGIVTLIAHKLILLRYEGIKFMYLNTLQTHELELKNNLTSFRVKFDGNEGTFHITQFLNEFKDGRYVPLEEIDERPKEFVKANKRIGLMAKILKFTFYLSIVLLLTNLSIIMYLILN